MMRYSILVAAVLILPTHRLPAGEQPAGKPEADPKLAILDRFAGEWTVEGRWSDGKPLSARGVYAWGLDRKIMITKTYVKDPAKGECQRYEGVMAWHPDKKCLFQISFAFDGAISEVLMEAKDKDTLHIGWGPLPGGKASKVRQTIRFLDNDRFQWVVALQAGDEWKEIIDATWKRKGN
jgi:hypothetical protein